MSTATTDIEFYRRNEDGTWSNYDMGTYPEFGRTISVEDTADEKALTEWLVEWLDGQPGEWYAVVGGVESDVVDNPQPLTIREVVSDLYAADVIADYHVHPDYIRMDMQNGWWVAVSEDWDPDNPDAEAFGYSWTLYDSDDVPVDTGGDATTATLTDQIGKLAV